VRHRRPRAAGRAGQLRLRLRSRRALGDRRRCAPRLRLRPRAALRSCGARVLAASLPAPRSDPSHRQRPRPRRDGACVGRRRDLHAGPRARLDQPRRHLARSARPRLPAAARRRVQLRRRGRAGALDSLRGPAGRRGARAPEPPLRCRVRRDGHALGRSRGASPRVRAGERRARARGRDHDRERDRVAARRRPRRALGREPPPGQRGAGHERSGQRHDHRGHRSPAAALRRDVRAHRRLGSGHPHRARRHDPRAASGDHLAPHAERAGFLPEPDLPERARRRARRRVAARRRALGRDGSRAAERAGSRRLERSALRRGAGRGAAGRARAARPAGGSGRRRAHPSLRVRLRAGGRQRGRGRRRAARGPGDACRRGGGGLARTLGLGGVRGPAPRGRAASGARLVELLHDRQRDVRRVPRRAASARTATLGSTASAATPTGSCPRASRATSR